MSTEQTAEQWTDVDARILAGDILGGRVAGVRVPQVRPRTCAVRLGNGSPARVEDNPWHPS
jgi:hypothetical protein